MDYFTISHVGRVRKKNEDAYLNLKGKRFSLFIVADGMGGHNAGEVASSITIKSISEFVKSNYGKVPNEELLRIACDNANREILELSKTDDKYYQMGTTVVISLIEDDNLYYANVGDSRIYRFFDEELTQLTKDHSVVQEMLDKGALTEEEAKYYPRNKITSALGIELKYKIDIEKIKLNKSDLILMTTDGLTDLVDDDDIEDVLSLNHPPRETCEILTYIANSTGGKDNITITCIKI